MVIDIDRIKDMLEVYELDFTADNVDLLTQMLELGSYKPVDEVLLDLKRLKEQMTIP